jgi:hypothetical protein
LRVPLLLILRRLATQVEQHRQHLLLAGGGDERRGARVLLHVLRVGLEAAEGAVGGCHGARIDALQIGRDGGKGLPEAVDVQAVEADAFVGR